MKTEEKINELNKEELLLYGKQLITEKEFQKASEVYKRILEIDPNNQEAVLQLFFNYILVKDYEEVFKYYDKLCDITKDNKDEEADNKYFLYLLNMITELPEKYQNQVKDIRLTDIKLNSQNKKYNNVTKQNNVRELAFYQKFIRALEQLQNKDNNNEIILQERIFKKLLKKALMVQNDNRNIITNLLQNKNYIEALEFIETIRTNHRLSYSEHQVYNLLKTYLEIDLTGKLPEITVLDTNNIIDAIKGKNYKLALEISNENEKINNSIQNKNILILVKDIVNLVNKIEERQKINPSEEKQETNVNIEMEDLNFVNKYYAQEIVISLKQGNINKTINIINNYLKEVGKEKYEFLILDLLKINLLENDMTFLKTLNAINYVALKKFENSINVYVQKFYKEITNKNYEIAKIYLDIILKLNKLSDSKINTNNLDQLLNSIKDKTQELEKTNKITSFIKEIDAKEENKKYILEKITTLNEKGIAVLEDISEENKLILNKVLESFPNIVSFKLGENNNKIYLRKYTKGLKIDYISLLKEAEVAYRNEDYNKAIEIYKKLLETKKPKTFIYSYLGMMYMKKQDIDAASNYFIIATELSKNQAVKYDYTELVRRINGQTSNTNKKAYVRMTTEDFEKDNNYYEIEKIEQIAKLIKEGKNIDEVCQMLGLEKEEKNIASLIIAREYYYQDNITKGDKYLNIVEKDSNKSKLVKTLLKEIQTNKKFYKYRENENRKKII